METAKTLAVLKALADGIDPPRANNFRPAALISIRTPCVRFSRRSACWTTPHHPSRRNPPRQENPPLKIRTPVVGRRRRAPGQDLRLGKSIEELAGMHKRSKWAIEARLARLGKIPEPPSRFPARSSSEIPQRRETRIQDAGLGTQ